MEGESIDEVSVEEEEERTETFVGEGDEEVEDVVEAEDEL